ncbi:unnamed protein product [Rhizoctonia solani]|uniref:Uncharacterized protein n=1 Tax=Rhizoctonia solani TaxID=456999 RepID=A0A8H3HTC3_9AGAM|nr:unnamed protein product [Rhizoctonia solani]
MGPHPSLEHVYLDGIRIHKAYRREYRSFRDLAVIWPNVRTLSMPSQHATLRELEDFATLPSLSHLTVKLNLRGSYFPGNPDFKTAPLRMLTSSGPVRLSPIYEDLSRSAGALLRLFPFLQGVSWSDDDPTRERLARFFNSEMLRFHKQFALNDSPEDIQLSVACSRGIKEKQTSLGYIIGGLIQAELDSDSDSNSESES